MTTAPDTALWPPDYPDRDSDRYATSYPRDENPASQSPPDDKRPEQRVTVRHPVLKAPPGEMRHTAEFMNRPRQTSHHGKSLCTCSRRSASLQRGQTTGVAVDQRHNLSLHFCTQPVLRRHPKYASGSPRYSRRENIFPPPAFSPRSRTTPLAHIAGRAPESLILSVSWYYAKVC